jgi:hypothetical protein
VIIHPKRLRILRPPRRGRGYFYNFGVIPAQMIAVEIGRDVMARSFLAVRVAGISIMPIAAIGLSTIAGVVAVGVTVEIIVAIVIAIIFSVIAIAFGVILVIIGIRVGEQSGERIRRRTGLGVRDSGINIDIAGIGPNVGLDIVEGIVEVYIAIGFAGVDVRRVDMRRVNVRFTKADALACLGGDWQFIGSPSTTSSS